MRLGIGVYRARRVVAHDSWAVLLVNILPARRGLICLHYVHMSGKTLLLLYSIVYHAITYHAITRLVQLWSKCSFS